MDRGGCLEKQDQSCEIVDYSVEKTFVISNTLQVIHMNINGAYTYCVMKYRRKIIISSINMMGDVKSLYDMVPSSKV